MRILIVGHILPYPPRGGNSLRNFNLIKECSKNHEIHLIGFYRESHLRGVSLNEAIKQLEKYCSKVVAIRYPTDKKRFRYYYVLLSNLARKEPYSASLYKSDEMTSEIRQALDEYEFDVMEIGEIGLLPYATLSPDLPKVLIHHNIESQLLFRRAEALSNPLSRWYMNLQASKTLKLERLASQLVDYHTTVSKPDKEELLQQCGDINVQVVPNGVDTEYFKPTDDAMEDGTLVFVGGLSWFPNKDGMTFFTRKIWPLIKAKSPQAKIYVVGGNASQSLIEFAEKEEDFILTGFVDDIRPLVTRSAVYVVPLRVGGGTRLKVLDAMAMKKAIVSTSRGCEGVEIEHRTSVMIADQPDQFADRVVELLEDANLRGRLAVEARRIAEQKYDWRKIAPKLESVYTQLARGSKASHTRQSQFREDPR